MDYRLDFALVVWIDCTKADDDAFGSMAATWADATVHCVWKLHGNACFSLVSLSRLDSDGLC